MDYCKTQLFFLFAGIGIYVSWSLGTGTGSSSGAQPNNSYAIVDTGRSNWGSTRISLYCCSSSRTSYGKIIFPNGGIRTTGGYTGYDSITRYSSSSTMAGCIYFSYSYSYWYGRRFFLSYPGVYTCSFDNNKFTSIALYSEGTTGNCEYRVYIDKGFLFQKRARFWLHYGFPWTKCASRLSIMPVQLSIAY